MGGLWLLMVGLALGAGGGWWAGCRRSRRGGAALAQRFTKAERGARGGELAAALAHEIKNPLTPIRGYARLLLRELGAVSEAERPLFDKGLGIIDAEAERIELRVQRALERARSVAPELVALPKLLAEVKAVAEVLPGVTKVELELGAGLPPVKAVEDGLQSALVNLVENAAEAMRDRPGPLSLHALRAGTEVRILVRDRGPGFGAGSTDDLTRSYTTSKSYGTGLGLAVTRTAVEQAHGRLELRNRVDGPGAEVELSLPAGRAARIA